MSEEIKEYEPTHDWEITAWEYDDTFFKCKNCGLRTHRRRGYPAFTPKECVKEELDPCKRRM